MPIPFCTRNVSQEKMGPLAKMSPIPPEIEILINLPNRSALSKMSPCHHLRDMHQIYKKGVKPLIVKFTGDSLIA